MSPNLWVAFFQGSELIVNYDEHLLTNTFKFGIIYQKFGQVRILLWNLPGKTTLRDLQR